MTTEDEEAVVPCFKCGAESDYLFDTTCLRRYVSEEVGACGDHAPGEIVEAFERTVGERSSS